jgi:adenylate cyclase
MSQLPHGELVPIGGGDPVPLVRSPMKIGRRDSCDICLRFPNISGEHSELTFTTGLWTVSDLGSTNGTKVNGVRVQRKVVRPGDEISFANRRFRIQYQIPADVANRHVVADEEVGSDVLHVPLLERAGLARRQRDDDSDERPRPKPKPRRHRPEPGK